ncbi:MAG: cob(I)yrinic acid a,c-diamide adenosyltransferase [Flavicella sp.]
MKIYTKTGDQGKTSLFGGSRVSKSHIRIETFGTVDELNSYIGLLRDQKIDNLTYETLVKIQKDLFAIGAVLATPDENMKKDKTKDKIDACSINDSHVSFLEKEIDRMDALLDPMTHFILPGGHTSVSYCHVSRCICRRAERWVVLLSENTSLNPVILEYLNRLSDYLFVLARKLTLDLGVKEEKWLP